MRTLSAISAILFALPICRGTFFLLDPPIHNADLASQIVSPCGGYKLGSSGHYRDYPQNGIPLHVNSSEVSGDWTFEYNLALKEDSWISLRPDYIQHQDSEFCIPSMPVPPEAIGQKGVLRVTQDVVGGQEYYLVRAILKYV